MMPLKVAAILKGTAPSGSHLKGSPQAGDSLEAAGREYTVEQVLGRGAEGDLYVVADQRHRYVLKRYRRGFHANSPVLAALSPLKGKGCIADILDFGEDFELMEYFPQGNAAQAAIKGNTEAILVIASRVAKGLDMMHGAGVIHKDVKPANILIRDTDRWDCVLCDFGIADLLTDDGSVVTRQVRTPLYAAPEVYEDVVVNGGLSYCRLTPKADFYSLGMTILALWKGENALLQKEHEPAMGGVSFCTTIPADMPSPLAAICRGLLIRNPQKRWGLQEVLGTIEG